MNAAHTVAPPRSLTTMQPFFRELAVNRETALALLHGLSATQLAWRPSETQWCLAEICSHLTTITMIYLPALDDAIRRGHADAAYTDRAFRGNVVSRLLVSSMEPPVRMRMKTPKILLPATSLNPEDARQQYRAAQNAFELRLERAAGLDLSHISLRLPTIKRFRFALGTVLALLLAHERRHLWQATVVRKSAAFPQSG
jgi:hypothetical protein